MYLIQQILLQQPVLMVCIFLMMVIAGLFNQTVLARNVFHYSTVNKMVRAVSAVIPNPTSSIARIAYKIPASKLTGILTLLSINGQIMQEVAVSGQEQSVELDVSKLAAGIYMYNLTVPGYKSLTKTLIVR